MRENRRIVDREKSSPKPRGMGGKRAAKGPQSNRAIQILYSKTNLGSSSVSGSWASLFLSPQMNERGVEKVCERASLRQTSRLSYSFYTSLKQK